MCLTGPRSHPRRGRGDFAYDALARWLRAQQLHRLCAGCSLAALLLNVALNLGLQSPAAPTRAPLVALIAQNSLLPLLLLGAYAVHRARAPRPALLSADAPSAPLSATDVFGPALGPQLATGLAAMLWTCAELWA